MPTRPKKPNHRTKPANQDALIAEILQLLGDASEQFEPHDAQIKRWMSENFRSPAIAELLNDMTFVMLRVLSAIGQSEPVNGITISKQSKIPKGSVSKVTRRLLTKKLITGETLPNNKKEILFRLTPLGKELDLAHRAFDAQMEKGFVKFLKRYSTQELSLFARVLSDFAETSFF